MEVLPTIVTRVTAPGSGRRARTFPRNASRMASKVMRAIRLGVSDDSPAVNQTRHHVAAVVGLRIGTHAAAVARHDGDPKERD